MSQIFKIITEQWWGITLLCVVVLALWLLLSALLYRQFFKRFYDIVFSLTGLVVLLPIFFIVIILIKLTSKGPVFFRQERLGRKGKPFKIYKFRTMVKNAENIGEGLRISSDKDPRITAIGRFLRATSMDELPQLFNVFFGQMSLVGPRPPVTYFPYNGYSSYPDWAKDRFLIKPGITGLAQVDIRVSRPWEERIKYDVKYVDNYSFCGDFKIFIKTILNLFLSKNIYMKTNKIENISNKECLSEESQNEN